LADTLAARFASLDFLIHIPKPGLVKTIDAMSLAEFRQAQHDIQHATFLAVRLGTEAIRRGGRGGSIVCVSGAAWRISGVGLGAVSSGDGGIRLITKSAALELGAERIRVNALQLAPTATDADAAAAALFLASDRSRFMTGAELLIDGGVMAGC
jgi:3alpha(or 20beta)-hydroxysteroid dehydrogenase